MKHLGLGLALCFASSTVGCVDSGSEANVPGTDIAVNVDSGGTSGTQLQDGVEPEPAQDIASEDAANGGPDNVVTEDFGKTCGSDADCQSGPCVQTANGSVCSKGCEDTCPEGWSCLPAKDTDSDGSVCVPDFATLCIPCSANAECNLPLGLGNERCIPRGSDGAFCGGSCESKDCPSGYACDEIADLDGEVSKQCVKEEGTCECSPLAISTQASTSCLLTNEFGSCSGERQCSEMGLSDCEGEEASAEICDNVDNNCDGEVDEDFPNTDGTGLADCLDEDDDDDGVADDMDCAPLDPAVFPSCVDKQCGDDGCGADCGECDANSLCIDNQCVCQPNCDGIECGGDGCGGNCGGCDANSLCIDNQCVCQPNCNGKECGGDGCGGSCGSCGGNDSCENNQCVCQPNCLGKQCGDDGCGGSCGSCVDTDCVNGVCTCKPNCENKECGDDGCGGSCGGCFGVGQKCAPIPPQYGGGTECICDISHPATCPLPGFIDCTGAKTANLCVKVGPCATWTPIYCFVGCFPGAKSDTCF